LFWLISLLSSWPYQFWPILAMLALPLVAMALAVAVGPQCLLLVLLIMMADVNGISDNP
jgi:hypothetical protein